jgi:hypothetical protein
MKKKKASELDREYLRATKASTPEQKLNWLAAAQELVREVRTRNSAKKQ